VIDRTRHVCYPLQARGAARVMGVAQTPGSLAISPALFTTRKSPGDGDFAFGIAPLSYRARDPDRGGHRFAHDWTTGLHPMALYNATGRFRILEIRGRRYQLAFRYETWVQYRSRRPLPRLDLAPLADRLNQAEGDEVLWRADAIDSLTPWLRMADDGESRLDPQSILRLVVDHLETSPAAFNPYV
jgi:Family of unknown function (DUF6687)